MIATITGIVGGLIVIMIFTVLKQFDKPTMYGLILSGIGFLYVGFTWTDLPSLIVCGIQAVVFVFIAHFGTRRHELHDRRLFPAWPLGSCLHAVRRTEVDPATL